MFPSPTNIPLLNQINKASGFGAGTSVPGVPAQPTNNIPKVKSDAGSTGGTTYSAPSAAQAAAAQNTAWWNAQNSALDDQINRLGGQQQVGTDNINRSYQAAYDSLNNDQTDANRQYTDTTNKTIQDNIDARNQIAGGVRSGLNGLQRLLGAHGAGNSSAATILAPYAAGLAGNEQTQQVQKSYAGNRSALDDNWAHTQQQYKEKFGALDADKANRTNSLLQNLADIRANLLNSKQQLIQQQGGAPNQAIADQIRALGAQSDQLGAVQTFDPGKVAYTTPALAQYAYDQTTAPTDSSQTPADQNLGVFSNLIASKDKKQATGAA